MKLEISQKTELALSALLALQGYDSPLKGAELAEQLGTTASYLPHVMRPLVRIGWVESDRGPTGGYRLVVQPSAITLFDLIEAVEGPIDDGRCVLRGSPCTEAQPCALHVPWQDARNAMTAQMQATPLDTIEPRGDP